MRKSIFLLVFLLLTGGTQTHAAFVSGSTGTLGAFNPTVNTVVTLPPDGILNYTTVTVPSGVTVTFKRNTWNTPVFLLATGAVSIVGTIDVSGSDGGVNEIGKGGPGGFDGGYGGAASISGGNGMGPGRGEPGEYPSGNGGGGGFGASGNNGKGVNPGNGGMAYGNARLLPLIGGSGGGGAGGSSTAIGWPGGGGGGAIVIASSTAITVTGAIMANGGMTYRNDYARYGGGGSGGIKLVSNTVSGNGNLTAAGGSGSLSEGDGGMGGAGIIRIEATINNRTAATNPPYSFGAPRGVFVPIMPTLKITSVGGSAVPLNPTGNYNQPDIILSSTFNSNPSVTVNVSAQNIPLPSNVTVTALPQYGAVSTDNTRTVVLAGTQQSSAASASVKLSTAYSNVITAQVTFAVTAMNYDDEEIEKIRLAATLGGDTETVYITKSGREIKESRAW